MSRLLDSQLSRRALIQTGLVAAAGLSLPTIATARGAGLITKPIPSSGERIPVIGIGTNAFHEDNHDELRAVLKRMHELGGTVIDTAAAYGESEGVIGKILAESHLRGKMFLATKFNAGADPMLGPKQEAVYGAESFERSVERLRAKRIDLMQVHSLSSVDALMPALQQYRKAGRVRYIGITTVFAGQYPQAVELMKKHPIDGILRRRNRGW